MKKQTRQHKQTSKPNKQRSKYWEPGEKQAQLAKPNQT
jgi:hypothetical protein